MPNDENLNTGEPQSSTASGASEPCAQCQEVCHYYRIPQGNYVDDGAVDTHHLGTDQLGAQKGKNGRKNRNFSVPNASGRG